MVSLSDYIKECGMEDAKSLLQGYRSFKESDTERFIHNLAIEMEQSDKCRTYLMISKKTGELWGFVTLSIKCIRVPENVLSKKILRRMNIESKTGIAQAYLLGQLSRSIDSPRGTGEKLMDLAMDVLANAKRSVGCRMLRLDCHDELIPYYQRYGFKFISKNEGSTLNRMMTIF